MSTSDSDSRMPAVLRPLAIHDLDADQSPRHSQNLDAEKLLKAVMAQGSDRDIGSYIARYREISGRDLDLIGVPSDPTILEKIVWPLISAKVSYCLGHYIACIAMCGLVGEMWAILLYELKATPEMLDKLSVSKFEEKGQQRRIEELRKAGLVKEELVQHLKIIAGVRRRYLHFLTSKHGQLQSDARKVYASAVAVVSHVALHLQPGSFAFSIDPDVFRFVKGK